MLFSALVGDPHEITRNGTRQLIEDLGGRVARETETASKATDFLEAAIRNVLSGNTHLSNSLPKALAETPSSLDEDPLLSKCLEGIPIEEMELAGALGPLEALTDRERQVLRLTAEGLTAPEIGKRISISKRTVEKHHEHIRDKLHVDNQVEMVRFAFQYGLAEPSPTRSRSAAGPVGTSA